MLDKFWDALNEKCVFTFTEALVNYVILFYNITSWDDVSPLSKILKTSVRILLEEREDVCVWWTGLEVNDIDEGLTRPQPNHDWPLKGESTILWGQTKLLWPSWPASLHTCFRIGSRIEALLFSWLPSCWRIQTETNYIHNSLCVDVMPENFYLPHF